MRERGGWVEGKDAFPGSWAALLCGHRARHCPANVGVLPLHSRCPASPMHAPHTLLRPARRPPGVSGGVGRRVCERGRRVQRRRGGAARRGGHGGGGASGGAGCARGSEGALPGGWVGGVEGGRRPTGGWMGGGRPPGRVGRILEGGWPACTLGGGLRWLAGVLGGSGRRGGRRGAGGRVGAGKLGWEVRRRSGWRTGRLSHSRKWPAIAGKQAGSRELGSAQTGRRAHSHYAAADPPHTPSLPHTHAHAHTP